MTENSNNKKIKQTCKRATINENAKVEARNELAYAKFNLSLMEFRLMLTIYANAVSDDKGYYATEFKISELAKAIRAGKNYGVVKDAAVSLLNLKINGKFVNGKEFYGSWISYSEYNPDDYSFLFYPNPILFDIFKVNYENGNFFQVKNRIMTSFSSIASARIYMILCTWQNLNKRKLEFKIDELVDMLQIDGKAYVETDKKGNKKLKGSQIKKHIITPAIEEINEHTGLDVDVEYKKRGRSIDSVIFTWHGNYTVKSSKTTAKLKDNIEDNDEPLTEENVLEITFEKSSEAYKALNRYFSEKAINCLLSKYPENQILENIELIEKQYQGKEVKAALVRSAIEENYSANQKELKENKTDVENSGKIKLTAAEKNAYEKIMAGEDLK